MGLTTHWSQIERLQGRAATDAWQWFIDRYRGFVTAALRRLIWSPDRAAAASDEFWGYLFQSGTVERLQRPMNFRAFLVSTLRNYAHAWMRRNPRPADGNDGDPGDDADLQADPRTPLPEDEEVMLWARSLLHLVLQRLENEQLRWASVLRSFYGLPATMDGGPVAPRRASELAAELGCTANALHQLLFRARQRVRDLVVEEVRQTVSNRRDLDAELGVLLAALGRDAPGIVAASAPAPEREEP